MSVGDRFCYRCYSWNCLCMELYRRDGPFFWFWNASIPDDKLTMTVGSDDDLDTLWQLRLTLTEIAWMARCEYERTKKFNEGYDAAVKGDG